MLFCLVVFYSVIFWEEYFRVSESLIFSHTYIGRQEGFPIGSVLSRIINYFCIPHTGQKLCKNNSIISSFRTASACQNCENPTKVTRLISKTTLVLLFITFFAPSQNDRTKSILPTTSTSEGEYWPHSDSGFSVQQSVIFWNYPTFPLNQLCLSMNSYTLPPQSPWHFWSIFPGTRVPTLCMPFSFLDFDMSGGGSQRVRGECRVLSLLCSREDCPSYPGDTRKEDPDRADCHPLLITDTAAACKVTGTKPAQEEIKSSSSLIFFCLFAPSDLGTQLIVSFINNPPGFSTSCLFWNGLPSWASLKLFLFLPAHCLPFWFYWCVCVNSLITCSNKKKRRGHRGNFHFLLMRLWPHWRKCTRNLSNVILVNTTPLMGLSYSHSCIACSTNQQSLFYILLLIFLSDLRETENCYRAVNSHFALDISAIHYPELGDPFTDLELHQHREELI